MSTRSNVNATHTADSTLPLCRNIVQAGTCKFGEKCRFRHAGLGGGAQSAGDTTAAAAATSSNTNRQAQRRQRNNNNDQQQQEQEQKPTNSGNNAPDKFDNKRFEYVGPVNSSSSSSYCLGLDPTAPESGRLGWNRDPPSVIQDLSKTTNNNNTTVISPLLLTSSTPQRGYRSRARDAKSSVHWGQRKLFFSELELFTFFTAPDAPPHWVVYIGAAPGSHLLFLDRLTSSKHSWELIDPGTFDHRLLSLNDDDDDAAASSSSSSVRDRFRVRTEYFDNGVAYELAARRLLRAGAPALASVYEHVIQLGLEQRQTDQHDHLITKGADPDEARRAVDVTIQNTPRIEPPLGIHLLYCATVAQRAPMVVLSDIRSGREDHGNFEEHVHQNMLSQECWVDIVQPTYAVLKFRLPYSFTSRYSDELKRQVMTPTTMPRFVEHTAGWVMLPLWTRPTSTETRLVVPAGAPKVLYDRVAYENQMFFFNSVLRETVHFDHGFDDDARNTFLDHRYDGAAELRVLEHYLLNHSERAAELRQAVRDHQLSSTTTSSSSPPVLINAIHELSELISTEIGSTFEKAIYNRDKIYVEKGARAGWVDETFSKLEKQREARGDDVWHRKLSLLPSSRNKDDDDDDHQAEREKIWDMVVMP